MFGGYYVGLPVDQGLNWQHYYHNGRPVQRPAHLRVRRHGPAPDAGRRVVAELADAPAAALPDRPRLLVAGPVAGRRPVADGGRPAVRPPLRGVGGPLQPTRAPTSPTSPRSPAACSRPRWRTRWCPRPPGARTASASATLRTAQVQIRYATQQLHLPVWGMSPSSTADDTGGYGGFGVEGLVFPYVGLGATAANPSLGLSQCHGCATEDTVTPARLLPRAGRAAPAGVRQPPGAARPVPGRLRALRLLRRRQPDDRRRRAPGPGARPVDDHGGAGQRPGAPGDAAALRPRTRSRSPPTCTCRPRRCRSGRAPIQGEGGLRGAPGISRTVRAGRPGGPARLAGPPPGDRRRSLLRRSTRARSPVCRSPSPTGGLAPAPAAPGDPWS